ncbi:MAG: FAD binding domain-containing protein [Ardenticatenaceae bacterium]|nr:FAD binding domain-containing protein [Ardenticatenaceae bacterium]
MVAQHQPLLAEALPHIAHPQIRNRGTFGGSLAHADPAAELPVIAVALNGRIKLQSAAAGERWIAARDFYTSLFTTDIGDRGAAGGDCPAAVARWNRHGLHRNGPAAWRLCAVWCGGVGDGGSAASVRTPDWFT